MVGDGEFVRLLAGAREGDGGAIATIYRRHQPRLLRVLQAEIGDAAEDVAQQTWLEMMGGLTRFEGDERGFRALLFTIARRRMADHRRLQRRRPARPTPPVELQAAVDGNRHVSVDALVAVSSDEAVKAVVDVLSPDQAEIVLLRVVADLSVDEVAWIVGKSAGAVRVQQHRALRRLAEALLEGEPNGL